MKSKLYSIIPFTKTHRIALYKATLYAVIASVLLIPVPMLLPLLIDELLLHHPGKLIDTIRQLFHTDRPQSVIIIVLILTVLLRIASFWASLKKTKHAVDISHSIGHALRRKLTDRLKHMRMEQYETLKNGDVIQKSLQDVDTVSAFISQLVINGPSSAVLFLGILGVLFWINWQLTLFVLAIQPIFFFLAQYLGKKRKTVTKQRLKAYEAYYNALHETLDIYPQIKVSAKEEHFFLRLYNHIDTLRRVAFAYTYKGAMIQNSAQLTTQIALDISRAAGIAAVLLSDLSIGMMISFLFYISMLMRPVQMLMQLIIQLQHITPALQRIDALMAMPTEPLGTLSYNPFSDTSGVAFSAKNLVFTYPAQTDATLCNVSFEVEPGDIIAVTGKSGNGKSTLAKLLVGLYRPTKGTVTCNGIPVSDIPPALLRRHVALVMQDTYFFNDTIRNNLLLGCDAYPSDIHTALQIAQLESFIASLPQGLDTRIGRDGIRLSGGQKQRLAIARLILSNPSAVILDEATSALDNETEKRVLDAFFKHFKGKTVILIAHKVSTLQYAKRIYRLSKGGIMPVRHIQEIITTTED